MNNTEDSLFHFPYNSHDWAVVCIFLVSYAVRMWMMHRTPEVPSPTRTDFVGIFFLSLLVLIVSYEFAIQRGFVVEHFYPILALEILFAKDILDFLMLSKEGRKILLETTKTALEMFLGRFGFEKKNNK